MPSDIHHEQLKSEIVVKIDGKEGVLDEVTESSDKSVSESQTDLTCQTFETEAEQRKTAGINV